MTDREFAAAAVLLDAVWFAREAVDSVARTIDWDAVDNGVKSYASSGERVLCGLARAMWTCREQPGAGITDAIQWLDEPAWDRVMAALQLRAGREVVAL